MGLLSSARERDLKRLDPMSQADLQSAAAFVLSLEYRSPAVSAESEFYYQEVCNDGHFGSVKGLDEDLWGVQLVLFE